MLVTTYILGLLAVATATIDKTFIVELAPASGLSGRSLSPHKAFHKRAEALEYSVRHEFNSPDVYLGLSLAVTSAGTNEEVKAQLSAIPGVLSVSQVQRTYLPVTNNVSADPFLSFSEPAPLQSTNSASSADLLSSLQMGGVDKLHDLGIKGKGIKIGIVDTGVDYRHPALGGGFGPGHKIAGGYSYISDNGTSINSPDPLTTCYGGGHGTHVSGIIGMNSVSPGFDIVGVAPEATLYMYKALDCLGQGGSDQMLAAMLQAQIDGVHLVSMSVGLGPQSIAGDTVDPIADVTKKLTDAGIAVIVAAANDAGPGKYSAFLYDEQWPSTEPSAIGVGATANKDFPVVYSAVDSKGSTIKYASVWPIDLPEGADVFMVSNGCDTDAWITALEVVTDVNNTVFAFNIGDGTTEGQLCQGLHVAGWKSASQQPVYLMGYNTANPDPFWNVYDVPSQGYFGDDIQYTNVNVDDGVTLAANYDSAGGYGKYKLKFPSKSFQSVAQVTGGYMDYYSDFGPTWHTYNLKPQIAAPAGHTLSTWPLGSLGGYAILSGTSMATPYVSGSFALIKSQFPKATIQQILDLIQTTATPLPWIYDTSIITTPAQQGAGQINVYNAIFSKSTVSPGQLLISDVTHTVYGTANITITNPSLLPKTYTLSHQGAGYTDYFLQYEEEQQVAKYGSATFKTSKVTILPGKSETVLFQISPPSDVNPNLQPVFGGFIKVVSDSETFHVPYIGPPYSLYNAAYLSISTSDPSLPGVYTLNATTGSNIYDTGFAEMNPSLGWGHAAPTLQFTTEMRIDVLPAKTAIKAEYYGFDPKASVPAYQAPSVTPTSKIFGFPSFGTLVRTDASTWKWPASYQNTLYDTVVTADDGSSFTIGNGDVRLYVSVLRAGGTSGVQADYETWLGPIIRFVDA